MTPVAGAKEKPASACVLANLQKRAYFNHKCILPQTPTSATGHLARMIAILFPSSPTPITLSRKPSI